MKRELKTFETKKGFTLIELMAVIAIIIVFVSIILAAISTARQNAREKRRVSDLAQVELALTLYKAKNREYPDTGTWVEIGVGNGIDSDIKSLIGSVPTDPIEDGAGAGYGYFYNPRFVCTKTGVYDAVLYTRLLEQKKNANFLSVCPDATAANKASLKDIYMVVLKP